MVFKFIFKQSKVFVFSGLLLIISNVFAQDAAVTDADLLKQAKVNKFVCESANGYLVANNNNADPELIKRINIGRKKQYQSIIDSKTNLPEIEKQAGAKLGVSADTTGACKSDVLVNSDLF